MEHNSKDGAPKVVKQCSFPLTAIECVKTIVTDLAVIEVTDAGLVLREVAPGWTAEEVQQFTEPRLSAASHVPEMKLKSWLR
jgi:3-oxoacid CoA-transferase B subunit